MLVFAGFAQSQKKKLGRGAKYFFVAAFLATASEVLSPLISMLSGPHHQQNSEMLLLVNLLQTLGFLFAWIGAWRVLSDDSA